LFCDSNEANADTRRAKCEVLIDEVSRTFRNCFPPEQQANAVIWGFRCGLHEIFAFLGCFTAWIGG